MRVPCSPPPPRPPQIGFIALSEMSECAITVRGQGEVARKERKESNGWRTSKKMSVYSKSAGDPLARDAPQAGRCRDPAL